MTKLLEVLKYKLQDLKQQQQKLNEIKEKISKINSSSTKEQIQELLDEIDNIIPASKKQLSLLRAYLIYATEEQRTEIQKIFTFNGLTSRSISYAFYVIKTKFNIKLPERKEEKQEAKTSTLDDGWIIDF